MKTGKKAITLFSVLFLLALFAGQVLAAQPTGLITYFPDSTGTSMVIKWTPGTPGNTLVAVKTDSTHTAPVDGTTYTANTVFGSGDDLGGGEFVVYAGSGNTVTVTGLVSGTTYYVAAYAYTGTTYETASPLTGQAVKRYGHAYDPNIVNTLGREMDCDDCHEATHNNSDFVPHGDVAYARCSAVCHNPTGLAATIIGNHKPDGSIDCGACHDLHETSTGRIRSDNTSRGGSIADNLSYIRADMTKYVPAAVTSNTVFQAKPAHYAFASNDPAGGPYNGVCQVCHTSTSHHTQALQAAGDDHQIAKNCTDCHQHSYDSLPGNNDAFTPFHLPNQFGWSTDCQYCHSDIDVPGIPTESVMQVHNYNCDNCHTTGQKPTAATVKVGDNNWGDATRAAGAASAATPFDPTLYTCATCHINPTRLSHGLKVSDGDIAPRHQISSDLQGGSGYDCESCHTHNFQNPSEQLTAHLPNDNGAASCATNCHNSTPSKRSGINNKEEINKVTFDTPVNPNDFKCEDCHAAKGDFKRHGLRDDGSEDDGIDNSSFDGTANTVVNHNNLSSANGQAVSYTGKLSTYGGIKVTTYSCDDCHSSNRIDATSLDAMQAHTIRGGGSGNCLTCHNGLTDFEAVIASGVSSGATPAAVNCEDCHNATINGGGTTNSPSGKRMYQYDGIRHHTTGHAQAGDCTWCHADPRPDPPTTANGFASTATGNPANTSNNGVGTYDTGWEADFAGVTCPTPPPKQLACRLCHTNYGTDGAGTAYSVNVSGGNGNHGYNLSGTAAQQTTGLTVWANDYYATHAPVVSMNSITTSADPITQAKIHRIDPNDGSSMINVYDYGACLGCHSVQIMHAAPIPTTDYQDGSACSNTPPYDTLRYAPGRSVFNFFRGTRTGTNQWDDHRYSDDSVEPYNPCGGSLKSRGKNVFKDVSQNKLPWNWGSIAHNLVSPPANANFSNYENLPGMSDPYPVPVFGDITAPAVPDNVQFISAVWDGTNVTVETVNDDGCAALSVRTRPDGTQQVAPGGFTNGAPCTVTFALASITGVTLDIETTNANGTNSTGNPITDNSSAPAGAVNDTYTVPNSGTTQLDVTANDSGTNLSITNVTQPSGGCGSTAISGLNIAYTATGTCGPATFTYEITSADFPASPSTATVTITAVANQPPAFQTPPYTAADASVGVAYTSTVAQDAVDPEGDPITYSRNGGTCSAWASVAADGTISGTPAAGDAGTCTVIVRATATGGFDEATVTINVVNDLPIDYGKVSSVGGSWQAVSFNRTFSTAPVVVITKEEATANAQHPNLRNVTTTGFEVRMFTTGGTVSAQTVHWVAVEPGSYTQATHGVHMDVISYSEPQTNNAVDWNEASPRAISGYTDPIVVGSVQTNVDTDWSAFWVSDSGNATTAVSGASTQMRIGKHVAEDPTTTRSTETVGYIIIEAGTGTMLGGTVYEAGSITGVRGWDNTPPFNATLTGITGTVGAAVAANQHMAGANGAYAVVNGPPNATTLPLVMEEDTLGDTEQSHAATEVGYLVIEGVNQPPAFQNPPYTAADASVGVAYTSTVAQDAVDPEGDPITYSRNGGTCSAWASVAGDGTISGTPAAGDVGTCTVIVRATATGGFDEATVTITVGLAPSTSIIGWGSGGTQNSTTFNGTIAYFDPNNPVPAAANGGNLVEIKFKSALAGVNVTFFICQPDNTGESITACQIPASNGFAAPVTTVGTGVNTYDISGSPLVVSTGDILGFYYSGGTPIGRENGAGFRYLFTQSGTLVPANNLNYTGIGPGASADELMIEGTVQY